MENVTCQRCQTINEFHVVDAGPHLKAVCDNCNRYIKFISKQYKTNNMATNIAIKIDVKKIEKAHLYVGEKGTYLDAVILMKDEVDQYGNIGMITQSVSKEQRAAGVKGAILGNVKYMANMATPTATPAPLTVAATADDLPF
jgi:hypothetical protein